MWAVEGIDEGPAEERNDRLGHRQGDVEKTHVLGGLALVGQRVAGERPVDGKVEAVANPICDAQCKHQRNGRRVEGDENDGDKRLSSAGQVDEDLAAMQTVRKQPAEETERQCCKHDDQQPVRGERVGARARCQHDITEKVVQVVQDGRDPARDHQSSEDDPGKVALVKRPKKFADSLADRSPRVGDDGRQALVASGPDRREQGEQDRGDENQIDRAVRAEQRCDPQATADAELGHRREEAAGFAELLGGHDVGDDPGVCGLGCVEEELHDDVAHDDLRVVARRHQQDESRNRQERAGDHDRAAPAESTVEAIGPGAHEWRHGHGKEPADADGKPYGAVLRAFGDHLVDLALDQDRGERYPHEVAAEPEGAERRVAHVPEAVLSGPDGADRRIHPRRLS